MSEEIVQEKRNEKQQVLLIENDLFFSSKISGILAQIGFETIQVSQQSQALERLRDHQIALIILALSLDTMEPILLIQKLKETPETSQIPMIAYAEHSQNELLQKAQDSGCEYVVTNRQIVQNLKELVEVSLAETERDSS